jgi:hypothetical protein
MRVIEPLALGIPDILLPRPGSDLNRWAVIACDQFTSEPEYWEKVRAYVGDSPSALNIIYPEVYLNEKEPEPRIQRIRDHMNRYMSEGLFIESEGFVYVERTTGTRIRKGLLACLDLEHYDFRKGSKSLIRATEGTILERIPPRVRIRDGAPLEIPHIMVLIDDPENTVIGPLEAGKKSLKEAYSFDLMMDSGHLAGYRVDHAALENGVLRALGALAEPGSFSDKYGLSTGTPVLLYAMGDGNHSLATAKTIWEKEKEKAKSGRREPRPLLRYALVELVNLHDEALIFEPIHRVLYGIDPGRNVIEELKAFFPGKCRFYVTENVKKMQSGVDAQREGLHRVGIVKEEGCSLIEIAGPRSNLPAGTIQDFLDKFLKSGGAGEIDYIHGTDSLVLIGKKPGNAGFYLPAMNKKDLFRTVILDGALPRKTFSMGEAWEKRFYMEARRLV